MKLLDCFCLRLSLRVILYRLGLTKSSSLFNATRTHSFTGLIYLSLLSPRPYKALQMESKFWKRDVLITTNHDCILLCHCIYCFWSFSLTISWLNYIRRISFGLAVENILFTSFSCNWAFLQDVELFDILLVTFLRRLQIMLFR